jgi:carbon storage regulator
VLILTRKAEQGIVIDRVTTVRILSIDGDRVKIGIDAPTSITVLREELLEQVAGQNREAARPAASRTAVERLRALRPDQNAETMASGDWQPASAGEKTRCDHRFFTLSMRMANAHVGRSLVDGAGSAGHS